MNIFSAALTFSDDELGAQKMGVDETVVGLPANEAEGEGRASSPSDTCPATHPPQGEAGSQPTEGKNGKGTKNKDKKKKKKGEKGKKHGKNEGASGKKPKKWKN